MQSGFSTSNRWGLTGTEDIGNAKVGFVLELVLTLMTAPPVRGGRLFGREAQGESFPVPTGNLYAGRIASIVSGLRALLVVW